MKFAVSELKSLSMLVPSLSTREYRALSAMLHRRQPDFCGIIDDVGMDPRCIQAHEFCTTFCAIAFKYAEEDVRSRLPRYSADEFQEIARFIARGEEAKIGKRACGYRNRIARHVLSHYDFDNDDTEWLCTTISAFLFITESSVRREKRRQTTQPGACSRRKEPRG
jgi:hypothetical protein